MPAPGRFPRARSTRARGYSLQRFANSRKNWGSRRRAAAGKWVDSFAIEGDLDADAIVSTAFEMEWPPKSGVMQSFPEIDRARWFTLREAHDKMLVSQRPLLDDLWAMLG